MKDRELGLASLRAFNDWTHEEWAGPYPDRIIPCQLAWLADPEIASEYVLLVEVFVDVSRVERALEAGHGVSAASLSAEGLDGAALGKALTGERRRVMRAVLAEADPAA